MLLRILILGSLSCCAFGGVVYFSGSDPGVGFGEARPNSDAAHSSFLAALGANFVVIDFEGQPAVMNLGFGVTYTPSQPDSSSGIFTTNDTIRGYNTTVGGTTHLRYSSSTADNLDAVFSFASPISAFGAYFTGVGTSGGAATILFSDGTQFSTTLTDQDSGGVQFFGFTDFGNSISAVTVRGNTADIFGIDDVTLDATVPEPSTLLTALPLAGLLLVRLARRRRG